MPGREPGAKEPRSPGGVTRLEWLFQLCVCGDAESNPVIEQLKLPRLHSNRR